MFPVGFSPASANLALIQNILSGGTLNQVTFTGGGSSTAADATTMPALFSAGASPNNGNMYGVAILVSGKDELFLGINKNSTTNSIPSNSLFLSSYLNNSTISIGRGNSAGQPGTPDIEITGPSGTPSILVGARAITTTSTDGFLYIPTAAGAPTGVPTAYSGLSPIYLDSTNNKIWIYISGAWKGIAVA